MTAEADSSVPGLLAQAVSRADDLVRDLRGAVRNLAWAYQDLRRENRLPEVENEPGVVASDAVLAEFASRSVLPVRMPDLLDAARAVVEALETLDELVPPLRAPKEETA